MKKESKKQIKNKVPVDAKSDSGVWCVLCCLGGFPLTPRDWTEKEPKRDNGKSRSSEQTAESNMFTKP